MKALLTRFLPNYPRVLIYMLQSTEYKPRAFLIWYWRVRDFRSVMHRRKLEATQVARTLLYVLQVGILLQLVASILLLLFSMKTGNMIYLIGGAVLFVSYPFAWAHLIVIPLVLGNVFVIQPKMRRLIEQSKVTFAHHPGTIIAVAGSYGKTSMKEILLTVLSEGKKVAATPANKNVASSHAQFARSLEGNEDIIIIEYGEGEPGDVARFCEYTQPDIGVITGLAPAHLDQYKTLQAAGEDIFSLAKYLKGNEVYVNAESEALKTFISSEHITYSAKGILGWTITDSSVDFDGTSFVMQKNGKALRLKSGLLGRHHIGPLAVAVALAEKLGLNDAQITSGVSKTIAYEHRMQPRALNGAWLIDDSYNGNIEGVRAGLRLLQDLPAQRKIYVTPGLVDQGEENARVHNLVGKLIAEAHPAQVVLMQNSATVHILKGLTEAGYDGEIKTETEPLHFYTNIEHFLAAGDLIMLQNDWTDNYQ